jgi:hypothetical protein
MLIGRMQKEMTDIRRCTVDFGTSWLDSGETIQEITDPMAELMGAWVPGPYPSWPDNTIPNVTLPDDPTPLLVDFWIILPTSTQVQMFLSSGTPGNFYRVSFIATGASGRAQTVEVIMSVKPQPTG